MGRKYPSDVAEKRRAKRSERDRLRIEAHAQALADDPDIQAAVAETERQLADGTFEPGRPAHEVVAELRAKYLSETVTPPS